MKKFFFNMIANLNFNIIYAFMVLLCTIVNSDTYSEEKSSSRQDISYDTYLLTEPTTDPANLCRPSNSKPLKITMKNRPNSAIIVKSGHKFHRWFNRIDNFTCKFIIKSPKSETIMAVVQTMSLRQDAQNKCLDYIKFERRDLTKTQRFCGQIDTTHRVSSGYAQISYTGEFDTEIETTIFVSRNSLRFDEEPINITITYTPLVCNVLTVESHRLMKNNICLAKGYICDGLQNCLPHICLDEKDCPATAGDTGSKVIIGAVTTIFLSFIIFLMGLWICRKHKKLCWSSDCAGPSMNSEGFPNVDRETANRVIPSSPMLNSVTAPAIDKDPPPSYNSLFPERASDS